MNQKMTVINGFGKKVYCVLSEQEDFENQLSEVFSIRKGQGYAIELVKDAILLKDVFHGDTVAKFQILSVEPCDLDVNLNWVACEED
ncbi:MAG: hypothetical protein IKD04_01685 [Clostridia bacterium]|nr:hypothetical protein [Clostridia bacterium]